MPNLESSAYVLAALRETGGAEGPATAPSALGGTAALSTRVRVGTEAPRGAMLQHPACTESQTRVPQSA
jgi:hypothetical protein